MEIGNALQSPTSPSSGATSRAEGGTAIASDFETFIKMLTVQMENQDPLNPVDSSDFAVQLATFSSVEQQVLTNDLLTDLGGQFETFGVLQMSNWIGMDARAEMPVFFQGQPVTFTPKVDALADTTQLVVRDAQGNEIQRFEIDPDIGQQIWAGRDEFGNPLPDGTYFVTTESFSRNTLLETQAVDVHDRIVEVRNSGGEIRLVMSSGQEVNASQIVGLRQPLATVE